MGMINWRSPRHELPPEIIPQGHVLIAYSDRVDVDEDFSLRPVFFGGVMDEMDGEKDWQWWSDWYGALPEPDMWAIIECHSSMKARWFMPSKEHRKHFKGKQA